MVGKIISMTMADCTVKARPWVDYGSRSTLTTPLGGLVE